MIPRIDKTYKNIRRFQQILGVFIKYGFGDILGRLSIEASIEKGKRLFRIGRDEAPSPSLTTPMRLRMALEELGPTFIKLGQILSARPDLLPADYIAELRKLQDEVPGFPFEQVQEILAEELGTHTGDIFVRIDPEPLAAASMSQVHRAALKDGREVVIKVLRPGIGKVINSDIDILYYLAGQFERHFPEFGLTNPRGVVREFEKSIRRELDFTFERNHINRFHEGFEENPNICIPEVFWDLSTKRVLTEEYLEGIKVTDLDGMSTLLKVDRLFLAEKGCEAILYQILTMGLFHGDPHPGNVLVLGHDKIGFLDFGIVGHLDAQTREALTLVLSAIFKRDLDRFIRYLFVIGTATRPVDRRAFRADALFFMDTYVGMERQKLEVGRMLIRFLELLRQYGLIIPADLVLLIKSVVTIEGVGMMLSPEFNITDVLAPYVTGLVTQQLQPAQVMTRLARYAEETLFFAKRVPEDFGETLRRVRENKLEIGFRHRGLDRLTSTMERAVNRLALAIFAGALILGSSLIIKYKVGPMFRGASVLGLAGYLLAFVIGMWVVTGIIRSMRI